MIKDPILITITKSLDKITEHALKTFMLEQIEFYIKYYDTNIKKPFCNPTIGITISKKVNKNIINYHEKNNIKHFKYEIVRK